MSDSTIPPCGPERDRLVAEAVGWKEVSDGLGGTLWVDAANKPTGYYSPNAMGKAGRPFRPSQSDADALAALEAWRLVGCRGVVIQSPVDLRDDDGYGPYCAEWEVTLDYWGGSLVTVSVAPTLADAATAALVRWRNERSAT